MKIQFLNGGLANQAFQYIFARYYELSHPGEIMYMDDSYFALNSVHNGYELEKVFGIKPHMLSSCFDEEVWGFILDERRNGKSVPQILCENDIPFTMLSEVGQWYKNFNPFEGVVNFVPSNGYYPGILDLSGDIYYHGYWINKGWFDRYREVFLEEFKFPELTDPMNLELLRQIQSTDSVSVHIRRGDFVNLGWALKPEVYPRMVEMLLDRAPGKWNLFVFSDDIAWCKENQSELGFNAFAHVTYVEGNVDGKNYIDMQLMSQCKGIIMSNSAFCYLATLLNTRRTACINPTSREV